MNRTLLHIVRELDSWSKSSRGFCCLLSSSVSQWDGGFSQRKEVWRFWIFCFSLSLCDFAVELQMQTQHNFNLFSDLLPNYHYSVVLVSSCILVLLGLLALTSPSVKHRWVVSSHCKVIRRWAKRVRAPRLAPMSDSFPPACYDS